MTNVVLPTFLCVLFFACIYAGIEIYKWLAQLDMHLYDPDWQVRWMYHELPIIEDCTKEMRAYAEALTKGFPGDKNRAVVGYLLGEHDVEIMEHRLNNRLDLRFDCSNT